MNDLVPVWQTDIPIRALDEEGWQQPGAFYVHIGTEDSLESSLPPGAVALVEPIDEEERLRPDPRAIYLLQFGNGYESGQLARLPKPFQSFRLDISCRFSQFATHHLSS